jgi:hypothetical protein
MATVLGSTSQQGISVEPRENRSLARNLPLAKGGDSWVRVTFRVARIGRPTQWLLSRPVGTWGGESRQATEPGPRHDDWITINKDYSSQRYVALDEITPQQIRFHAISQHIRTAVRLDLEAGGA